MAFPLTLLLDSFDRPPQLLNTGAWGIPLVGSTALQIVTTGLTVPYSTAGKTRLQAGALAGRRHLDFYKLPRNYVAGQAFSASLGYWTATTFGPDCEVYVTVPAPEVGTSSDGIDLMLRLTSPGATPSGYDLYIQTDGSGWTFWRL